MPEQYQDVALHIKLMSTAAYKKIKNSLKQRHQTRRVWINLDEELSNVYLDDGNNVQFKDYFLEESPKQQLEKQVTTTGGITEEMLTNILDKFSTKKEEKCATAGGMTEEMLTNILEKFSTKKEDAQNNNSKSLKKLSEIFVLQKFTNKNSNVIQWITLFESECDRLEIKGNEEKIEVLRLFLEGSCLDWYSSMLIKHTINSEWKIWRDDFCETYADKGWIPVKYAISFKYINGSLLDYALKKERILLEMNKAIDTNTLIDLIATGLPDLVTDKINRIYLKQTKDLFNELRSLEHLTKTNTSEKKQNLNMNFKERPKEKKPCRICEKLGKSNCYHLEQSCWFKKNEKGETEKKNETPYVHNAQIEAELNDIDLKN